MALVKQAAAPQPYRPIGAYPGSGTYGPTPTPPPPPPPPAPTVAGFEGNPVYQGTDIYNAPVYDPNSGSLDPTGWAPIYAPPPEQATSIPGLSPGDWVAPYDPASGVPNPYVPSGG
jgi:hypothetical protein